MDPSRNNSPEKASEKKNERRDSVALKKVIMDFTSFEEIIKKVPKRIQKAPVEDYETRKLNLEKKAIEQMRQRYNPDARMFKMSLGVFGS